MCSLGIEVERLEREWRLKKKGAHLRGYFLSWLPLLSFSPYYQGVWCQTRLIYLRWEERYKVQTKNWKWQMIILRGENACSCCEVCFSLSVPWLVHQEGLKKEHSSLYLRNTNRLCIHVPSLPFLSLLQFNLSFSISGLFLFTSQHALHLLDFSSLAILCISAPTLLQPWTQTEVYLIFNLQCTLQPYIYQHATAHLHHTPTSACDEFCSRSQHFYALPKKELDRE